MWREQCPQSVHDAVHERIVGMEGPMDALAVYEVRDGAIRRLWIGHE